MKIYHCILLINSYKLKLIYIIKGIVNRIIAKPRIKEFFNRSLNIKALHEQKLNEEKVELGCLSDLQYVMLIEYVNDEGTFDYEKYRSIQEQGNVNKINNIWVNEGNVKFLSKYIIDIISNPRNGICHGTRRGKEQEWFSRYTGAKVIGTEISSTAAQFPNTIEWDFHNTKPEWKDHFDFIYSNSFDHSYHPEKCLNAWMESLKPGGVCIIEHSNLHSVTGVTDLDPFGAHIVVMPYLITLWAKGRYFIKEILNAPYISQVDYLFFIIISKNK